MFKFFFSHLNVSSLSNVERIFSFFPVPVHPIFWYNFQVQPFIIFPRIFFSTKNTFPPPNLVVSLFKEFILNINFCHHFVLFCVCVWVFCRLISMAENINHQPSTKLNRIKPNITSQLKRIWWIKKQQTTTTKKPVNRI